MILYSIGAQLYSETKDTDECLIETCRHYMYIILYVLNYAPVNKRKQSQTAVSVMCFSVDSTQCHIYGIDLITIGDILSRDRIVSLLITIWQQEEFFKYSLQPSHDKVLFHDAQALCLQHILRLIELNQLPLYQDTYPVKKQPLTFLS